MRISLKLFIVLILPMLLMTCFMQPVAAQEDVPEQSPFAFVLMGSGFVEDNFDQDTWGGGVKLGFLQKLDKTKGLYLRTLYSRFEFGEKSALTHSLDYSLLLKWYAGRKWDIYMNLGASTHIGGEFSGTDPIGGVGFSRIIYTDDSGNNTKPFTAKAFFEIDLADSDGQLAGNYAQVNIGFTLARPEK